MRAGERASDNPFDLGKRNRHFVALLCEQKVCQGGILAHPGPPWVHMYIICTTYGRPGQLIVAPLPPSRWREPAGGVLDHLRQREQALLVERAADELQPERQALR